MAATRMMRIVRRSCRTLRTRRSIWMVSGRMLRRKMRMMRTRICYRVVSLSSAPRVRRSRMTTAHHARLWAPPTIHPQPSPPLRLSQPRLPRERPPRRLLPLPREVVLATLCQPPLLPLQPLRSSVTLAIVLMIGSGTLALPM